MTRPSLLQNNTFIRVLYIFTTVYIFGIWVWSADTPTTSFNGDPRSKLSEIIYGTAHKPYVQRFLVPIMTRAIYDIVPQSVWNSIQFRLTSVPKMQKEMQRLGWEQDFLPEYLIALMLAFISLAAFPFVIRSLWQTLYDTEDGISNLAPVIALFVLPTIFPTGPHYIYDFPALALFTAGLLLILKQRWLMFYPVFILGCLNKETTILLTFVFAVQFWSSLPRRLLALHVVVQTAIFTVIKIIATQMFLDNPGSALEFRLHANIHILLSGYSFTTLFFVGVVMALLMFDFRQKHPALKNMASVGIPLGILWIVWGVVTEIRALYEFYSIASLLGLHTILFSILKQPYRMNDLDTSAGR